MDKAKDVFGITLVLPDGSERTLKTGADEHLWDAAQKAGLHLPALCHQGWCLTCAGRLDGEGCVDHADSAAYFSQDGERGYVLLCTAKPCSSLRLRTGQARAMRRHRRRLGLPAPYSDL